VERRAIAASWRLRSGHIERESRRRAAGLHAVPEHLLCARPRPVPRSPERRTRSPARARSRRATPRRPSPARARSRPARGRRCGRAITPSKAMPCAQTTGPGCLDKPCIIDKKDPSKAACACTSVKDQGPYVIVGNTYNDQTAPPASFPQRPSRRSTRSRTS
jgi:hypothetical protein